MATRRADRRVERTRTALMQAFVGMLLAENLESISVAGIVARANVGRSTFYTHFRGRDDILKASLSVPSLPLARAATEEVAPAALVPLLAHFRAQRRLVRVFASAPLRRLWVRRLTELIEPALSLRARHLAARPLLPIALVAAEIAELQIALIVQWLEGRSPAAPEAVAEAIVALTRAAVAALLGQPSTAPAHM
jgi:AcrR family transcriptional regulator